MQTEQITLGQRQKARLDYLTKELNLDAKQRQQVANLMTEKNANIKNLKAQKEALDAKGDKATTAEKDALKKQLMAEKNDYNAKMKKVLTSDQYKKWLIIKEDSKEEMKGKMLKMEESK